MAKLTKSQRDTIIEMLANGEELPPDYKHMLFPPEADSSRREIAAPTQRIYLDNKTHFG